jgi:glycosyltransferase involved in cell wall biosynthesis
MAQLCLNMIVRNEADKMLRCLESVAPWINCYAILDTGSTDGTQKNIKDFFVDRSIPGIIKQGTFKTFDQARNDGLALARSFSGNFNYILLLDADMELQVEDKTCFDNLTDTAYDIVQKAGGISYFNRRLIRRDQTGGYIGVTHEYLDIGAGSQLLGCHFIDHADGSNRPDKFARDIKLLLAALKKEPTNGRYMYYLAQSFRDKGEPQSAANWYKKRMNAGGWDEEAWSARVNYAHCLKALNDEDGFIRELLAAYNFRPSRAESLYDLAKHYRDKTQQNTSLLFSVEGMKIPRPADVLFVTDHVYTTGLREEFAICAFYNPTYRKQGYKVCSDLAIDPVAYEATRILARNNLFYYIQPLKELCTSFKAQQIDFKPPGDYTAMNPSVALVDKTLYTIVRTVNYIIDKDGRYQIKSSATGEINNTNPIHTRNFLLRLDPELRVETSREVLPPADMPKPKFDLVIGFEDMRLFFWQAELWTSSTVRELNAEGWCEQTLAHIHLNSPTQLNTWQTICPPTRQHEKNWMPWVDGSPLKFVYKLGQIVDLKGKITTPSTIPFNVDRLSGGSQVVPFNGGWLALVHESATRPGDGQRYYQHRFAWWDATKNLRQISQAFVFHDRQIEFAAGLAPHPVDRKMVISYGIRDCEAWLATVDNVDIAHLLAGGP